MYTYIGWLLAHRLLASCITILLYLNEYQLYMFTASRIAKLCPGTKVYAYTYSFFTVLPADIGKLINPCSLSVIHDQLNIFMGNFVAITITTLLAFTVEYFIKENKIFRLVL